MRRPLPKERLGDFLEDVGASPVVVSVSKEYESLCGQTLAGIVADLRKMMVVCCGKRHEEPESMLFPVNCPFMKCNLACGHIKDEIGHRLRSYLWLARQLQLLQEESEYACSPMILLRKLELQLQVCEQESFTLDALANVSYNYPGARGSVSIAELRRQEHELGKRMQVIRDALLGAFASILQEYEASSG